MTGELARITHEARCLVGTVWCLTQRMAPQRGGQCSFDTQISVPNPVWLRSWEQLADLNAQQSVAVIDETAAALATIPGGAVLDTVNQVFMVRSSVRNDVKSNWAPNGRC